MARNPVQSVLLPILIDGGPKSWTIKSLMSVSGLSFMQCREFMWRVAKKNPGAVDVIAQGNVWYWNGINVDARKEKKEDAVKPASKRVFEELLAISDHEFVVRDDNGTVYKATLERLSS